MEVMLDLNKIRDDIDVTDKQIVELFEKRMKLCESVAEYKIANGKEVLDVTREKQKIEKVVGLAGNDFNKKSVEELFKQIMAMSRKMQYQLLEANGTTTEKVPYEPIAKLTKEKLPEIISGSFTHIKI